MKQSAEANAHARGQTLIEDIGRLFTSEPQDSAVKETSSLIDQDDGTAKGSADVHYVLGRERVNFIELEGAAKDSAVVHFVLEKESGNLIELEEAAKGTADVHCSRKRVS